MTTPLDPRIPALSAMAERGVGRVLADAGLNDALVLERVLRHRVGRRCALVLSGDAGKILVKAYRDAEPPMHYLSAVTALENGNQEPDAVRAARVLASDPALHFIATEWFEAASGTQLLESGQGRRCGTLGVRWVTGKRVAADDFSPVKESVPPLVRAEDKLRTISKVSAALGGSAARVLAMLRSRLPAGPGDLLCHGSFKPEHVFDLGPGTGLVDWDSARAGPSELDAGSFLGKLSMLRIERPHLGGEVQQARESFLSQTSHVLGRESLAGYEAFSLLKGAGTACRLYGATAVVLAGQFLDESVRVLEKR